MPCSPSSLPLLPPHSPLPPPHSPCPSLPPFSPHSLTSTEVVSSLTYSMVVGTLKPSITYPSLPSHSFITPALTPCSLLTTPCSPTLSCSPLPPHSLGPWDLPGASGSLGSLWKPSAALGLQSDSGTLFPLLSLTPPFPLTPLASLGPWGPSWGLRKPWEPSKAFGSLGSSVRLRGLFPLALPHLLAPLLPLIPLTPKPPWVPGTFFWPQETLGTFGSLWQPWVFSQTQGPCSPCSSLSPSPLTPLTPLTP